MVLTVAAPCADIDLHVYDNLNSALFIEAA